VNEKHEIECKSIMNRYNKKYINLTKFNIEIVILSGL